MPDFHQAIANKEDGFARKSLFLVISSILGLIGWPTLARRIRTHLLSERSQDYVLAAQLCGASSNHIIRRHLLPSFTSYIIVDLMITFPYMVRLETALSFIGLGLIDPVSSLGSLMQNVSNKKDQEYVKSNLQDAKFFLKALQNRNITILKTAKIDGEL